MTEFQKTKDTKYASAETSAREWAEVTAKANMHKGKWSEYWEEAKAAGDLGNQKVSLPLPIFDSKHRAEHDLYNAQQTSLYCWDAHDPFNQT